MTLESAGKKHQSFWTTLFLLALIIVFLWFLMKIGTIIGYFAIAGAIAYILNPAVEALCRRKTPRSLAILLMFLIFVGIITLSIIFFIPPAKREFKDLVDNLPQYFETLKSLWSQLVNFSKSSDLPVKFENLPEQIAGDMQRVISNAGSSIFSSISSFFSGLAAFVIVPILVFYFLQDSDKMRTAFLSYVPAPWRDETAGLLTKINLALGGFVRGQLKLCLAMGILTWLSLAIIARLEYALIFGVIAGITEFIPYLGPILALIGPLIFATTISWKMVAVVAGLFVVIQLIEGNILAPRIIGKDVDMHPAFIILVLMAGGQVGGIVGMIAAIPTAVILKVFFEHFYVQKIIIPLDKANEPENDPPENKD